MRRLKGFAVCLFVVLFSLFMISGCSLKNETLDPKTEALIKALNAEDEDAFTGLLYPSQGYDAHSLFTQFIAFWKPVNYEDVKLIRINVSNNIQSGLSIKAYEGIYQLPRNDEYKQLRIVYSVTDKGSGITDLYLGNFIAQNKTVSIVNLISTIICLAGIVITIVDVIRQRPPKFGVYIFIAFLFFYFRINGISLAVPVGAISYWCVRKKILEHKEARSGQDNNLMNQD